MVYISKIIIGCIIQDFRFEICFASWYGFKRAGFDGVVHFIPGLFNDDLNFRGLEERTANMIAAQKIGYDSTHKMDKSELYAEDVQLISKDGKIYYLPESKAE